MVKYSNGREKKDVEVKVGLVTKDDFKFAVCSNTIGDRVTLSISLDDIMLDFDLPTDSRAARYLEEKGIIGR